MRRWVPVVTLLGALIAFLLVAWLFETWIRRADGRWGEAFQATTALVLVVITVLYVWVTYRILRVQEYPLRALRLAAREDAADELAASLMRRRLLVWSHHQLFPLGKWAEGPAAVEQALSYGPELEAFHEDVAVVFPRLPQEVQDQTQRLIGALLDVLADHHQLSLLQKLWTETGETWDWDRARQIWRSYWSDQDPSDQAQASTFDALLGGASVKQLARSFEATEGRLSQYRSLENPNQFDQPGSG